MEPPSRTVATAQPGQRRPPSESGRADGRPGKPPARSPPSCVHSRLPPPTSSRQRPPGPARSQAQGRPEGTYPKPTPMGRDGSSWAPGLGLRGAARPAVIFESRGAAEGSESAAERRRGGEGRAARQLQSHRVARGGPEHGDPEASPGGQRLMETHRAEKARCRQTRACGVSSRRTPGAPDADWEGLCPDAFEGAGPG